MKKRENQQRTEMRNKKSNSSELSKLNDELGSFGLEPPKIYRNEQSKRVASKQNNKKKNNSNAKRSAFDSTGITNPSKKKSSNSNSHLTTQQQRIEQNKRRRQKQKIRKAVYAIVIAVSVIAVTSILILTVFFKIDTINISGNSRYTEQQVLSVLTVKPDDNLFASDLSKAEENLKQGLPYIYDVEIKRGFPSTINVNIKEADIIYSVKNNDKTYTILDSDLKVLQSGIGEKPKNAIKIKKLGITGALEGRIAEISNEQQKKDILALTNVISDLDLADKITEISSDNINMNYVVYDGRITIKLGTTENIEDKLYSALTVIEEKLNKSNPNATGTLTATGDKEIYFTEE